MIVVDGAVDLPEEALAWGDVCTVPARVHVDGAPFEGLPASFWRALRDGRPVATAAPSVSDLADAYRRDTSVLAVHVSGELSLTVARAREAAARVAGPVLVVDSGSLSVGAGLAALDARRLLAGSTSFDDARRAAAALAERVHTFAVVEDPAWLVRSGRTGVLPAHVAMHRPLVLAVHGRPVVLGQPKDRWSALKHLARRIHDHWLVGASAWALGHADAADVERAAALLAGALGGPPAFVVPVDPTVGAHLGPDALVVGVLH